MMVRQMVYVLSRQKPHLMLFMILSILSGIAYLLGPAESAALENELPTWVPPVWAWFLLMSGLVGMWGMVWQRWQVERGMLLERGALLIQAGAILLYGGVLVVANGWAATVSAGAALVWAGANFWESRLILRDLRMLEEVSE